MSLCLFKKQVFFFIGGDEIIVSQLNLSLCYFIFAIRERVLVSLSASLHTRTQVFETIQWWAFIKPCFPFLCACAGFISLFEGSPPLSLHPVSALRRLVSSVSASPSSVGLQTAPPLEHLFCKQRFRRVFATAFRKPKSSVSIRTYFWTVLLSAPMPIFISLSTSVWLI